MRKVLEKSSFLNEVGAAIHVAPNATRILKAWGVDLASLQPVRCERLVIWDAKEERVLKIAAVCFPPISFDWGVGGWIGLADL